MSLLTEPRKSRHHFHGILSVTQVSSLSRGRTVQGVNTGRQGSQGGILESGYHEHLLRGGLTFLYCSLSAECRAAKLTGSQGLMCGHRASGRGFSTVVGWKPGQLVAWSCLRTKQTFAIRIQGSLGLSRQSLLSSLLALSANVH